MSGSYRPIDERVRLQYGLSDWTRDVCDCECVHRRWQTRDESRAECAVWVTEREVAARVGAISVSCVPSCEPVCQKTRLESDSTVGTPISSHEAQSRKYDTHAHAHPALVPVSSSQLPRHAPVTLAGRAPPSRTLPTSSPPSTTPGPAPPGRPRRRHGTATARPRRSNPSNRTLLIRTFESAND